LRYGNAASSARVTGKPEVILNCLCTGLNLLDRSVGTMLPRKRLRFWCREGSNPHEVDWLQPTNFFKIASLNLQKNRKERHFAIVRNPGFFSGSGGVEARTLSGQRRAALCRRTNVTALQEMV
jgi:hypothetical protein